LTFKQWIEKARLRCESVTEGPWRWEAEDRLVSLTGPKDKFVLAAYACKSCAKNLRELPAEDQAKVDRHCMWPNKIDGDFIEHSRLDMDIAIRIVSLIADHVKRWEKHSDPTLSLWFTGIMQEMERIVEERMEKTT
jgi:hypothetical protein